MPVTKNATVDKAALREWHHIYPGVMWRVVGFTIPVIEYSVFKYVSRPETSGCITWGEAEKRALLFAKAFKAGVKDIINSQEHASD